MIIQLGPTWRLESDELQWVLQRRWGKWRAVGFFGTLDHAIIACARQRINLVPGTFPPEALIELTEALDTVKADVKRALVEIEDKKAA